MKPAKRAPYFSLVISVFLTYLMMVVSVVYGNLATRHKRGLFVSFLRVSSQSLVLPHAYPSLDLPPQGDPVERTIVCVDLLWHHCLRRNEARYHRVSHSAYIYAYVERGKIYAVQQYTQKKAVPKNYLMV